MILIACVDENNGILFNHRRLSRDREVSMRILEDCNGQPLYMNAYSQILFASLPMPKLLCISSDYLKNAGKGTYCFVEDLAVNDYWGKVDEIIFYRWIRKYPSDHQLLLPSDFSLVTCESFRGYSHAEIHRELYLREKNE